MTKKKSMFNYVGLCELLGYSKQAIREDNNSSKHADLMTELKSTERKIIKKYSKNI